MYTVSYYKFGSQWYLDYPEYLEHGDEDDLARIGNFADFLDMASENKETVTFMMDVHPFEGSDSLILTSSSGDRSGGYYYIRQLGDKEIDLEIWFNSVIYSGQKTLPTNIYIKKVS